jgi:RHH-type transcriptional regulator, rel operon repressor / antitoxin RelB
MEKNMSAISIRLPDDVSARLQNLAELTGRSKTFYMIEAIKEYIEDIEDVYLAESRLADLRAGKSKTIPLAEVMKQYGMDS